MDDSIRPDWYKELEANEEYPFWMCEDAIDVNFVDGNYYVNMISIQQYFEGHRLIHVNGVRFYAKDEFKHKSNLYLFIAAMGWILNHNSFLVMLEMIDPLDRKSVLEACHEEGFTIYKVYVKPETVSEESQDFIETHHWIITHEAFANDFANTDNIKLDDQENKWDKQDKQDIFQNYMLLL